MVDRGVIKNKELATQVRNFGGMRWGNITPTDLDGLIEYHNKGYVYIETKYGETELPKGQELALERLHDDMRKEKPVLTIIATHYSTPPDDIDVANTTVSRYRTKSGEWRFCETTTTTKELIDRFFDWIDRGEP
jgi:hypothetical protein